MRIIDFDDGFQTSNPSPFESLDERYMSRIGDTDTTGSVGIGGNLDVSGNGTVDGTLDVNDDVDIDGSLNVTQDVVIQGNLTVNGTQTVLNTQTLEVEDQNILVNKGGNDASSEGAGLTVVRTITNAALQFENALASKFKIGLIGALYEIIVSGVAQTIDGIKTFTSSPLVPTPDLSDNSTKAANTSWVTSKISAGGYTTSSKNADFTVDTINDAYFIDASSGNILVTFPAVSTLAKKILLVRTDDSFNWVKLLPDGSETFNDLPELFLTEKNMCVELIPDGSSTLKILYKGKY